MDYEFRKLNNVDIATEPAESANVLIEENGVIKKAPKTAIGGGINVTAEVGQTIVVKSVDENGKPTEWEAVKKVSSWDDLEGKPFYENVEEKVILPQTTIDGFEPFLGSQNNYVTQIEPPAVLNEESSYTVIFDGVKYEALKMDNNGLISGGETIDGTYHVQIDKDWIIFTNDATKTSHTLEVYEVVKELKALDKKFLPEHLHFGSNVSEIEILAPTTVSEFDRISDGYQGCIDFLLNIEGGKYYNVYIDGVNYQKIQAVYDERQGITALTVDNFNIIKYGETIYIGVYREYVEGVTHTVAVYEVAEEVTPINGKYLPYIHIEYYIGGRIKCNHSFDELVKKVKNYDVLGFLSVYGEDYYSHENKLIENIWLKTSSGDTVHGDDIADSIEILCGEKEFIIYRNNTIEYVDNGPT